MRILKRRVLKRACNRPPLICLAGLASLALFFCLTGEITRRYTVPTVGRCESPEVKRRLATKVNCQALLAGDEEEQGHAEEMMACRTSKSLSGDDYIRLTQNCSTFLSSRDYSKAPLSKEEEDFPIAFSIMMYKDIEQAERLLRAIYQPQNFYCIHVDKKAERSIHEGMAAIASCFNNVFFISNPIDVVWGTFTVLEQELVCMRKLWKKRKWKYYINLTGQEFPLKTNYELVKILKAFNGSNSIKGTTQFTYKYRWAFDGTPPHGITPVVGSVHITACRGFVDYVLHNQTALDILNWVKHTTIPDETYFSTLNHNPHLGVPGAYKGYPETDEDTYPFLTRYKLWNFWSSPLTCKMRNSVCSNPCLGKYVRMVCIFSVKDLPAISTQPHLFANKFHLDYQPLARQCLEEWHHNRTRDRLVFSRDFGISYYRNLSFVKDKV